MACWRSPSKRARSWCRQTLCSATSTTRPSAMELGFIGLGKMGLPMVARLLAAGHRVHVYNRSRAAVDELASQGASPAADAEEVARRSQAVMTALPTIEAVLSTYETLADVAKRDQIFVDHSTVSTDINRACAAKLDSRGAFFLDAPVSGGPVRRQAGRRSASGSRTDRHVVRRLDDDDAQSAAHDEARFHRSHLGEAAAQGPRHHPRRGSEARRAASPWWACRAALP